MVPALMSDNASDHRVSLRLHSKPRDGLDHQIAFKLGAMQQGCRTTSQIVILNVNHVASSLLDPMITCCHFGECPVFRFPVWLELLIDECLSNL